MRTPMPAQRIRQLKAHEQRGAAMLVALILLIVLSLLGAASARMTVLEERMTGNTQDRSIAFEAAEAALRDGERQLEAGALPVFNGVSGFHPEPDPTEPPLWQTVNWSSGAVGTYDRFDGAPGLLARAEAAWIVEELPNVRLPGESLACCEPVGDDGFFRITSRGVGSAGNGVVMLQSTYKR